MCGRYSLGSDPEELRDEFGLPEIPFDYHPRFNIAPTQDVPVLVLRDGAPRLARLRWGLVPYWAEDLSVGNRLINARAESVAEKPAFRRAFERRRCLVLADGFYEWRRGPGGKRPLRIRLATGRPFGMAGVWERWQDPAGERVYSCAIVTTAASPFMRPIHDRMPVILDRGARQRWLDPEASKEELAALLDPPESLELEAYLVSPLVNSPANDGPECIEAVAEDEEGAWLGPLWK